MLHKFRGRINAALPTHHLPQAPGSWPPCLSHCCFFFGYSFRCHLRERSGGKVRCARVSAGVCHSCGLLFHWKTSASCGVHTWSSKPLKAPSTAGGLERTGRACKALIESRGRCTTFSRATASCRDGKRVAKVVKAILLVIRPRLKPCVSHTKTGRKL